MHFLKQLICAIIFASVKVYASTMQELFHLKYPEVYGPREEELIDIIEEDGSLVQIPLLPPLSLHTSTLTDPDFLVKLENFETDPLVAFRDRNMKFYLLRLAARDYDTDPISRRIINRCLEYGLPPSHTLNLMMYAAEYNLKNLFFEILNDYNAIGMFYSTGNAGIFQQTSSLIDALIRNGRYSWTREMISKGFQFFGAKHSCRLIFTIGPEAEVDEAIEFLDFLLNQRQEFHINEPVLLGRFENNPIPLLRFLLSANRSRGYKEALGKFLVNCGADYNMSSGLDEMTPLQLAIQQGVNLF